MTRSYAHTWLLTDQYFSWTSQQAVSVKKSCLLGRKRRCSLTGSSCVYVAFTILLKEEIPVDISFLYFNIWFLEKLSRRGLPKYRSLLKCFLNFNYSFGVFLIKKYSNPSKNVLYINLKSGKLEAC